MTRGYRLHRTLGYSPRIHFEANHKNTLWAKNGIHAFGYNTDLDEMWNSMSQMLGAGPGKFWALHCLLDKYWTNQDVVYDYKSDLKGTGRPAVCA